LAATWPNWRWLGEVKSSFGSFFAHSATQCGKKNDSQIMKKSLQMGAPSAYFFYVFWLDTASKIHAKSLISLKKNTLMCLMSDKLVIQWEKVQLSGEKWFFKDFPTCSKVLRLSVLMRKVGSRCRPGIVTS
jgi:hypothetical protein